MSDSKSAIGGIGATPFIFAAIGYFVYGGLDGAIGMFLLAFASNLTALVCVVPFIGIGIYYVLATEIVYPYILNFAGIEPTWLTAVLFALHFIMGLLLTAFTSIFTAGAILKEVI